jgi:hypothetical protein
LNPESLDVVFRVLAHEYGYTPEQIGTLTDKQVTVLLKGHVTMETAVDHSEVGRVVAQLEKELGRKPDYFTEVLPRLKG